MKINMKINIHKTKTMIIALNNKRQRMALEEQNIEQVREFLRRGVQGNKRHYGEINE